ncbi:MAG: SAM-dependent DNA methyltransferase [Anaerolineae bacterium]|nr:SAM-dependent DNA methyltransferase [Anaerolineae bacterium]
MESFAARSLDIGQSILEGRSLRARKEHGQFLTPIILADFMVGQLGPIRNGDRILDPAMGSGALLCALIDRLVREDHPVEVWIDGFEIDPELYAAAQFVLTAARDSAAARGIQVHLNLFREDFVHHALRALHPSLFDERNSPPRFHHIIANPPYFKIRATDGRRKAAEPVLDGHTNIYTLFMGLAARMLADGSATFVVPRSFCSGAYFARFRRDFLEYVAPVRVHVFEARDDAFREDEVLQENIVITFAPRRAGNGTFSVALSASATLSELRKGVSHRQVAWQRFVGKRNSFRLPLSDLDDAVLDIIDAWPGSLHQYGIEISTGPIVPFRNEGVFLFAPDGHAVAPFLWMQNVTAQQVIWPLNRRFHKPQYIRHEPRTRSLLIRNANYVLLRRFSAKEERRRLVAAPFIATQHSYSYIGLENHLNYLYRRTGSLTVDEAVGLSALLNSGLIDRYFRISNGNTQVNAVEMRTLPLPPLPVIEAIGRAAAERGEHADLDSIVTENLQAFMQVPPHFPILRETRTP